MSHSLESLQNVVANLLDEAKQQGASQAEAAVHAQSGLDVGVRLGEIETIERTSDHGLGVTVYFGQRKGSASTTDLTPNAIKETVEAACRIAKYTSEDPASGLADAEKMAASIPDLDLNHHWSVSADEAAEIALRCEAAAREADTRISNSEGASTHTQATAYVYANSHGFVGGYPATRHSLSCSVIAGTGDQMQRDYWYSSSRLAEKLDSAESVGLKAAERAIARLNSRKIKTTKCPVLFSAEMAGGLMRGLFGAMRGSAIYRDASFLGGKVNEQLFPDWVNIAEQPHLLQALGSAPFDNEGVATTDKKLIDAGRLTTYLLDSYSARKLKMTTTGHAGGVRNPIIQSTGQSRDELLKEMGTGLYITELMGQGSNTVTGDYSRGAAGFWIENGEIAYPVEEITVAGNLQQMFQDLEAVATDNDIPSSYNTGSWLIKQMTVAGN